MVQYEWEILSFYTAPSQDGLNDVVKRITWRYQAKDGSYAGEIYRDTYLNSPNPNQFVQFNNLTSETVIGWIQSVEDMGEVNECVLAKLEENKNPPFVEKKAPWDYESKYDFKDKYVLVHNDEVVYGPVHWHSSTMNIRLASLCIEQSLPEDIFARKQGIVPVNQPTIIDDSTKIYKADMQNEQPEESLFYDNGHIIWDFSSGVAVGTYVAIDKPIEEIKNNLRSKAAQLRFQREFVGTDVTIGGNTYKIMTETISVFWLLKKLTTMEDDETCNWKFMEDKWRVVTKQDVANMFNAVNSYIDSLTDWEYNLVQQINAADTINELKQISIE